MKRMCLAPLCIAVLAACHAVNAQEKGPVNCQPDAHAKAVGKEAEVQLGSEGGNGTKPPEKEAAAILELGAAPARSLSGGGWTLSPTIAAEVTPIENWLELEFGVTTTFSNHSTE